MFFVLITLLGQTTTTNVANNDSTQEEIILDQEEEYFNVTEYALSTIISKFIYKIKAKRYGFFKRTIKEDVIKEYFALELELFGLLIDYYEMKNQDVGFCENRDAELANLRISIIDKYRGNYEVFFEFYKYTDKGVFRYTEVGKDAIKMYKEKIEPFLLERDTIEANAQNPVVCSSSGPKDTRMRMILNLINITFKYSLNHREKVYEKYGIKQENATVQEINTRNFLVENTGYIAKNESIYRLAIKARNVIDKRIADDPSVPSKKSCAAVGICSLICCPCICIGCGFYSIVKAFRN